MTGPIYVWSSLVSPRGPVSDLPMKLFFDMDDRARLPGRFYGACTRVLARL